MSGLKYVGRAPDSDSSLVSKKYADDRYGTIKVDAPYIDGQVAAQAVTHNLVTKSYIDASDAARSLKTAVDAADAAYVPDTQVGAANGIVPVDNNTYIPSTYHPALVTNRKPFYVPATTVFLTSSVSVATSNNKEYQAASLTITDPGFPYIPLLFATIQGGAFSSTNVPGHGTTNYGQITILHSNNTKYGWGLCTSSPMADFHMALPFGDNTVDPSTYPPLTGNNTFGLWLSLWGGTSYTFNGLDLNFHAMVWPGLN